jgi:3'-phosphoadenosine 5'-phosphosulfate sulfotransferase (PAPS reductase)/FAD synthetase
MSRDPFKIEGPACLSFSGGRSSAYLLYRVLQAHGWVLPPDVLVCFANTGKERPETLDFVDQCGREFGVHIHWLEFVSRAADGFKVVDYDSASRNGEPFDALIGQKQRLPNVVQRACTEELKVNTINRFLKHAQLGDADIVVGVRADEAHRIPRLRANGRLLPMADAGISKPHVHAFWRAHSFDLALPYSDGEGNCDLCFQKTLGQVMARITEKPSRAVWWAAKEAETGARFHKDRPTYQKMADFVRDQRDMFTDPDEEAIPCFCGD